MLTFQEVSFTYPGGREAMLKRLSFHVEKGEFVSMIGASGCGKSTIFRLINGLETPDSGQICFMGKPVERKKPIGAYMPQKDLLFPWRTIFNNLALPMEIAGQKKEERKKHCEELLQEVGLFSDRDKYPHELSGGMRQKASFARTLLTGAELLLLDEPFSALDSLTRMALQEWLLTEWEHFQKTILFITHDVEEAIFLSKKIFIIKDRPISGFHEVEVPLPYPRERQFLADPEIVALKEQLIGWLRQKVEV